MAVSQSSTCYPAVHPVPDPTAQAGFSSVLKHLIQTEPPALPPDSEITHQTSSLHVEPPLALSSPTPPDSESEQETFVNKEMAENGGMKVTSPSCTLNIHLRTSRSSLLNVSRLVCSRGFKAFEWKTKMIRAVVLNPGSIAPPGFQGFRFFF